MRSLSQRVALVEMLSRIGNISEREKERKMKILKVYKVVDENGIPIEDRENWKLIDIIVGNTIDYCLEEAGSLYPLLDYCFVNCN